MLPQKRSPSPEHLGSRMVRTTSMHCEEDFKDLQLQRSLEALAPILQTIPAAHSQFGMPLFTRKTVEFISPKDGNTYQFLIFHGARNIVNQKVIPVTVAVQGPASGPILFFSKNDPFGAGNLASIVGRGDSPMEGAICVEHRVFADLKARWYTHNPLDNSDQLEEMLAASRLGGLIALANIVRGRTVYMVPKKDQFKVDGRTDAEAAAACKEMEEFIKEEICTLLRNTDLLTVRGALKELRSDAAQMDPFSDPLKYLTAGGGFPVGLKANMDEFDRVVPILMWLTRLDFATRSGRTFALFDVLNRLNARFVELNDNKIYGMEPIPKLSLHDYDFDNQTPLQALVDPAAKARTDLDAYERRLEELFQADNRQGIFEALCGSDPDLKHNRLAKSHIVLAKLLDGSITLPEEVVATITALLTERQAPPRRTIDEHVERAKASIEAAGMHPLLSLGSAWEVLTRVGQPMAV